MKMTLEKFNECISQYVRGYIVPNAKEKSTLFKVGVGYGLGLIGVNNEQLATMKAVGIADADNNIDIDLLKKGIEGGIDMAGELEVEKLGITLYKADLDKFFRLVETGTVQ
jgi:hypothetical protein